MTKIKKCSGDGLCSCTLCTSMGRWSLEWYSWCYEIEGYDGTYCCKCMKELTGGNYEYEKEKS